MRSDERPVRVIRPGDQPPSDAAQAMTATQRLEMMWHLACDAWAFMGRAC